MEKRRSIAKLTKAERILLNISQESADQEQSILSDLQDVSSMRVQIYTSRKGSVAKDLLI